MATPGDEGRRPEGTTPPSDVPEPRSAASSEQSQAEVDRLRAEVAGLQAKVDQTSPPPPGQGTFVTRKVIAAILVLLAAFGAAASVVGIWADRTAFNTDRFVNAVEPLPRDPQVNAAVSTYITTEVFRALKVENQISEALPERASFLAGPLTTQVRDFVRTAVGKVLGTSQFQAVWGQVIRLAHGKAVAIAEGDSSVVKANGNKVTLDLLPVVNQVLRSLNQQVPTIFGQDVKLPKLKNGKIPPNLENRIENATGVSLPNNFAKLTFYDSGRLEAVQDGVSLFKRVMTWLIIGTLVLLALAFLVSPTRRRTALQFGVWLAIAVIVLGALIRSVVSNMVQDVPAGTYRTGVESGADIVLGGLRGQIYLLLALGIIIAVVAYVIGPGRGAVAIRRGATRGARSGSDQARRLTTVTRADGPGFAARNLDALRIGGIVVAAVVILLLSSWVSLLVILLLLVAYEAVVTLAARQSGQAGTSVGTGTTEPPSGAGAPGAAQAPAQGRPADDPSSTAPMQPPDKQ